MALKVTRENLNYFCMENVVSNRESPHETTENETHDIVTQPAGSEGHLFAMGSQDYINMAGYCKSRRPGDCVSEWELDNRVM